MNTEIETRKVNGKDSIGHPVFIAEQVCRLSRYSRSRVTFTCSACDIRSIQRGFNGTYEVRGDEWNIYMPYTEMRGFLAGLVLASKTVDYSK